MFIRQNNQKGFLLVEILVAVTLFVVVVTISLGSILSILDANRKIRATKDVMDNLNASIEYMTRIIRFGHTYHCPTPGTLTDPLSCPGGGDSIAVQFRKPGAGADSTFQFNRSGSTINVVEDGVSKPLTASGVTITHLRFYVFGTDPTNDIQPYVVALIRGYVGAELDARSTFDIQTVMTQRQLDLDL